MKKLLCVLMVISLSASGALFAQKTEGLAPTPPMGWNSWNRFGCNINEQLIRETADMLVETGLRDAGYIYLNMDDCWHGERDAQGFIQPDSVHFPSGIKALADYVHSKGLKFGIYSDAGWQTCAGKPGSFGHEYQDAQTYASWGVDYLKYDWCNTDDINHIGAYRLMSAALRDTGRPIVFSICEWGGRKPWEWAEPIGHLWRTTFDICALFDENSGKEKPWWAGTVMQILDLNADLRAYAGPDHWNDPDMLEVGNGMAVNEDRAHFTMWCMLAAPLMLGNDLRNMSEETAAILMNKEVIAIDQDPLGIQGLRVEAKEGIEVWMKPLVNGEWAFCVLNRTGEEKTVEINWQRYNLDDPVSNRSTSFYNTTYKLNNLWSGAAEGTTKRDKKVVVPSRDVILYRLTPVK